MHMSLIDRRITKIVNARSVTLGLATTFFLLSLAAAILMRIFDHHDFPTLGTRDLVVAPDGHDRRLRRHRPDHAHRSRDRRRRARAQHLVHRLPHRRRDEHRDPQPGSTREGSGPIEAGGGLAGDSRRADARRELRSRRWTHGSNRSKASSRPDQPELREPARGWSGRAAGRSGGTRGPARSATRGDSSLASR